MVIALDSGFETWPGHRFTRSGSTVSVAYFGGTFKKTNRQFFSVLIKRLLELSVFDQQQRNRPEQSARTLIIQWTYQNSKQINVAGTFSQHETQENTLVLVLRQWVKNHSINQSLSVARLSQTKCKFIASRCPSRFGPPNLNLRLGGHIH